MHEPHFQLHTRSAEKLYNKLLTLFPEVRFVETLEALIAEGVDLEQDVEYLSDVDYLGYVGDKAFGIQVKPTMAKADFDNYSVSERMKNSFAAFSEEFSGKVFIIFSVDGEIGDPDIIPEIAAEIERLRG